MEFYHIEPQIGFTHVLKAYTDVDHFIELQLMLNHTPLDCSAAIGVSATADKYKLKPEAFDLSQMDKGILKINFKGIPVGGYRVPITVAFPDRTIVFGSVTVFVSDTTRSDDIAVFHQYPDTEPEEIEWAFHGTNSAVVPVEYGHIEFWAVTPEPYILVFCAIKNPGVEFLQRVFWRKIAFAAIIKNLVIGDWVSCYPPILCHGFSERTNLYHRFLLVYSNTERIRNVISLTMNKACRTNLQDYASHFYTKCLDINNNVS